LSIQPFLVVGSDGDEILNGDPSLERVHDGEAVVLRAAGSWTVGFAAILEQMVIGAQDPANQTARAIDLSAVEHLDAFGAWLIERLRRSLNLSGGEIALLGLPAQHARLFDEMRLVEAMPARAGPVLTIAVLVERIGQRVAGVGSALIALLEMLGAVLAASGRVLLHPSSLRLTSTIHHIEQVCWRAVPIVVLITFLVGSIIAQQGIFHFRKFGADIFVVDMLGVLVLREIGVLLVAIMVAGRSGSAYTAELGSMKMREELDALRTMGVDPIGVLVLPRMLALVIAMPILAFLGAMAALSGGGLVAWLYGGVPPEAFLARLRDAISIDHFIVGLIKAPVMAVVIGITACVEGLAVRGSAESLGRHTTASVVKGIFFVIVMDGVFAIFFASIGM